MNIKSQLAIIIPTHCRPLLVERALAYYGQFEVEVVVVDSSPQPMTMDLPRNIRYLHRPAKSFAERVGMALIELDKPFVALCPDDDFLAIDGIERGVKYLMDHADYSAVNGRYISFSANAASIEISVCYAETKDYSISSDDPSSRVFTAMDEYANTMYSVFRFNVMEQAIHLAKSVEEVTAVEISLVLIGSLLGKTHTLPVFWMARDVARYSDYVSLDGQRYQAQNPISTLVPPTMVVTDWVSYLQSGSGKSLRKEFGNLFERVTTKSAEEGEALFDAAFHSYCGKHNVPSVDNTDLKNSCQSKIKKMKLYLLYRIKKLSEPIQPNWPGYPWTCDRALIDWLTMKDVILGHVQCWKKQVIN